MVTTDSPIGWTGSSNVEVTSGSEKKPTTFRVSSPMFLTACVQRHTVYRHFPTKDDLVVALADYRFQRLAELAREALAEDDPGAAFERFLDVEGPAGDPAVRERVSSLLQELRRGLN